jgi:peptidyl-prolyl cis-trans isomerase B (cyclophilin B)
VAKNRTRQRQLKKLADRRAAERRRARRNRLLAIVVAFAVAAGGGVFAFLAFTGGDVTPAASGSPTPTPSPTPSPTSAGEVACGGKVPKAAGEEKKMFDKAPDMQIDENKTYTATMKTSCGTIEIELFADKTPKTVNSFVFLARRKFFDGLIFHRVIKGFMIQGGDPLGTGTGGPGYQFDDEIVKGLTFDEPGLLAMANAGPGTNGSQFFITVSEPTHLDGKHTIFGKVTKGYDVAERIAGLPVDAQDRTVETVYIESVTIEES